jgi:anti-sigma-K factor RskA
MSQPIEIHTLSGAYALDALTEIERAGFARHISECQACAQEVAEFGETASRLSAAAWEVPPPRLRDAVLAEVRQTRQVTAGRAERIGNVDVARWRRWTAASVAAGVVALGGMAAVWVVQEQRIDDAERQAAQVSSVIDSRDVTVKGADYNGGRVTVATSPARDAGVVVMENFPAPPAGKVYQLWLIDHGAATSVGYMEPGQRSGTMYVPAVGHADTIGVTLEPEGGSTAPTSAPVAGVTLT